MAKHPGCVAWWPTPSATDGKGSVMGESLERRRAMTRGVRLPEQIMRQMWATPDAYTRGGAQSPEKRKAGGHSVSLQDQAGGSLNPTWVEWLQGFPLEHTACAPSEMPKSRSKPRSRGESSQEAKSWT